MTDGLNLIFILLMLAIPVWASFSLNSAYTKYSRKKALNGLSGVEVARMILDKNGLEKVHVVQTKGSLTDHYDPRRKVVRLSSKIFNDNSIASVAVAAHEVGHAIQDKENYTFMQIRGALVPFVNFSTQIGYFVTIIGLIAGALQIFTIGILLISVMLVFQLITLPVEFDASKRALIELEALGFLQQEELTGAKIMLKAAAMTYVAAVVTTLLNILRLVLIMSDRD